jgi:hypothetical protein
MRRKIGHLSRWPGPSRLESPAFENCVWALDGRRSKVEAGLRTVSTTDEDVGKGAGVWTTGNPGYKDDEVTRAITWAKS